VLAGAEEFEPSLMTERSLDGLPSTERRRINETSRLACLAAVDALATLPAGAGIEMPAIFTSSDGDGLVLAQVLSALARSDSVVSPTAFHNSVYNAPAGYWTIATRSTAPSTTVCADRESFAVALLEGYAQATMKKGAVLVAAVDAPFPEAIRSLGSSAVRCRDRPRRIPGCNGRATDRAMDHRCSTGACARRRSSCGSLCRQRRRRGVAASARARASRCGPD
jgi:hypothetical protein